MQDKVLNTIKRESFYPTQTEADSDYFRRLDKHRLDVLYLLMKVAVDISNRAFNHDVSKYDEEEKLLFRGTTTSDTEYGSEKYFKKIEAIKEGCELHYKKNRHHPEHFDNGIEDMTLMDLIEMTFDWLSASRSYNDGDIYKSIEINKSRFKLDDQVEKIIINTIKYMEKFYENN